LRERKTRLWQQVLLKVTSRPRNFEKQRAAKLARQPANFMLLAVKFVWLSTGIATVPRHNPSGTTKGQVRRYVSA
jgi:hypothetical protein